MKRRAREEVEFEKKVREEEERRETEMIFDAVRLEQLYVGAGIYFVRYSDEIIAKFNSLGLAEGFAYIVAVYKGRKFISIPFQRDKHFVEVFADKIKEAHRVS